jgi:hypothetical protein
MRSALGWNQCGIACARSRVHIWRVITISISPAAFAASASTLPQVYKAVRRPDGKGGYLITLDRHVVDRLAAMRRRGESYGDVILRIAKGDAA